MEIFTAAEVARHNKPNDLWVILDNKVYDITNWHILHPGGSSLLLKYGGRDATQASQDAHGLLKKPVSIMPRYFIGLVGSEEEVRAAEDRKVRKLLEDAKTQKALEAQKEVLKAADEEAVSSAPVSPASVATPTLQSPASPVAPVPSPSMEPGAPAEAKAKRDSNYAKATYTLLLERMAADRQAVESMISRVKATASKTAAKMTGRGSGAAGPKSEKSEGLGNSDPEDLFSDTERKQALQELESEESVAKSGLPQKKASDPRVAAKTAALEQASAEKKAAADKAAAEKKEAASKAAAEKKAAADKAAAEKKAAGDKAAADKTAAEAEKAAASQKAAAEKAAAEKAEKAAAEKAAAEKGAAEKAAAEKAAAEKAEKAAAEKAEKAAQQKAAKKAAEKALAEKEAAEKALAEMKAAKEQAEREAAELKAQAEQFQREKEAAEKKANKAAKKAESAKSKLLIVFQSPDGKERKTVTFTKRPLGVSCNMDSMPIVVGELPQGEAYTAGVREGWVLCQVGNDPSNMRNFPRSAAEPYASVQETFKFLGQLTKELPQVAS